MKYLIILIFFLLFEFYLSGFITLNEFLCIIGGSCFTLVYTSVYLVRKYGSLDENKNVE